MLHLKDTHNETVPWKKIQIYTKSINTGVYVIKGSISWKYDDLN